MLMPDIDIDSLNFSADVEQSVKDAAGFGESTKERKSKRTRSASVEARVAAKNMQELYGEDFKNVDAQADDEIEALDEEVTDSPYAAYHNKEQQKKLRESAPALGSVFDEFTERQRWNTELGVSRAKQRYQLQDMQLAVADKTGDTKRRDKVLKQRAALIEMYRAHVGQLGAEAAMLAQNGHVVEAKDTQKRAEALAAAFPEAFTQEKAAKKAEPKKAEPKKAEPKKAEPKKAEAEGNTRAPILAHTDSPFEGKKKFAAEHTLWQAIHKAGAKSEKEVRAAIKPHLKKLFGFDPKKHDEKSALDLVMTELKKTKMFKV